jgi:transcriptional regulator GlxA family with amidase domain
LKEQNKVIQEVINYMEDNLESDLDLNQISKHVGYSKFHLNRIFTEEVGCTIYKYLQTKRLTLAAKKLTTTDYSITQIAYEAGYNSQQAFTLAFRQLYEYPPLTYRKLSMAKTVGHSLTLLSDKNVLKHSFYRMEVMAA